MALFLYMPISNVSRWRNDKARIDRQDAGMDAYERGGLLAFVGCGNSERNILPSNMNIAWSKSAPKTVGFSGTPYHQGASEAMGRIWTHDALGVYHGTIPRDPAKVRVQSKARVNALAQVTSSDVLYLLGHGSASGPFIVHEENIGVEGKTNYTYKLGADSVANALRHEGLPRNHVYIKVNMCFGAGADGSATSFAQLLAKELGALGYGEVLVGGYQFPLLHDGNDTNFAAFVTKRDKTELQFLSGSTLKDAYSARVNPAARESMFDKDPYRCWYNATGSCVRWNEPDLQFGGMSLKAAPVFEQSSVAHAQWVKMQKDKEDWIKHLQAKPPARK